MPERLKEILAAAVQSQRPVLVNPTEDEIQKTAERLRLERKLICTACHKPILEPDFHSRRVSLGPRLVAIAHLHPDCDTNPVEVADEEAEQPIS
ncbi:MAG: hypothetical protein ACM3XM_21100 [Mycobacterium leprae]